MASKESGFHGMRGNACPSKLVTGIETMLDYLTEGISRTQFLESGGFCEVVGTPAWWT
jgi:hypothetical protein